MNRIHATNCFSIASSLVLLAILFCSQGSFAQIPKRFLKFAEKQNRMKSGYVKFQRFDSYDNDTVSVEEQELFFISTPSDFKYLLYIPTLYTSNVFCKSAHATVCLHTRKDFESILYLYDGVIEDAKSKPHLYFLIADDFSVYGKRNYLFQRIPPQMGKKNIRYKIVFPDQEKDLLTNISEEYEFDKKTFHWIQEESSATLAKTEVLFYRIDVLEQHLYDYIHPDILDTISFKFEELKKGYDQQYAVKQAEKDSVFRDSIVRSVANNAGAWAEDLPQDAQEEKETVFFMPPWKFPLLSGDTIYSDSINSQFLLIDMWYASCYPCRRAMHELSSIDTLYDESLLKMVSINVSDKDTAKMNKVVRNINLKSDVACAYDSGYQIEMSKEMGECRGYPQLYLVDMETKRVIWHSCGWYAGFTKDIEKIIIAKK